MSDEATVFDGLDGKVYLNDSGLTFERSKARAAGRGVGVLHSVPWSSIRSAAIEKNSLRVDVAGYDRPRLSVSDPNAVDMRRGQHDAGQHFLALIQQRATGTEAVPSFDLAPAPVAHVAAHTVLEPRRPVSERVLGFSVFATGVAAIAWAVFMLAAVACLAIVGYIIITG